MNIGILILSFQTLHFYPYLDTHWNSYSPYLIHLNVGILALAIFIHIGILTTSFQALILILSSHCKHWNSALFLKTLELSFYPSKHWKSGPFLYTLVFLCDLFKQWNPSPIFIHIGTIILSFQTLESWPYNFKPLGFWPYFYIHCNSHLILPSTIILALFLYTLEFWPHLS